jgi:Tfp pilus assembly major pilin PilA
VYPSPTVRAEEDPDLVRSASGPGAGDEGLFDELVGGGVKAVAQAIKDADLDVMDTVKEAGKEVVKKARGAAATAASAAQKASAQGVQRAASAAGAAVSAVGRAASPANLKHTASSIAASIQSVAVGQAGNINDPFMPEADLRDGGRREVRAGGRGKGGMTMSLGGAAVRSPRQQGGGEDNQSPERAVADMIQSSFGQPSGEEAFLHLMTGAHAFAPAGDCAENPGATRRPFTYCNEKLLTFYLSCTIAGREAEAEDVSPSTKSPKRKRPKSGSSTRTQEATAQGFPAPASPGHADSSTALVPLETAAALSAATMAHLTLQAELKQQAQGHATAVVRALKEMTSQRRVMEQSLEKIAL